MTTATDQFLPSAPEATEVEGETAHLHANDTTPRMERMLFVYQRGYHHGYIKAMGILQQYKVLHAEKNGSSMEGGVDRKPAFISDVLEVSADHFSVLSDSPYTAIVAINVKLTFESSNYLQGSSLKQLFVAHHNEANQFVVLGWQCSAALRDVAVFHECLERMESVSSSGDMLKTLFFLYFGGKDTPFLRQIIQHSNALTHLIVIHPKSCALTSFTLSDVGKLEKLQLICVEAAFDKCNGCLEFPGDINISGTFREGGDIVIKNKHATSIFLSLHRHFDDKKESGASQDEKRPALSSSERVEVSMPFGSSSLRSLHFVGDISFILPKPIEQIPSNEDCAFYRKTFPHRGTEKMVVEGDVCESTLAILQAMPRIPSLEFRGSSWSVEPGATSCASRPCFLLSSQVCFKRCTGMWDGSIFQWRDTASKRSVIVTSDAKDKFSISEFDLAVGELAFHVNEFDTYKTFKKNLGDLASIEKLTIHGTTPADYANVGHLAIPHLPRLSFLSLRLVSTVPGGTPSSNLTFQGETYPNLNEMHIAFDRYCLINFPNISVPFGGLVNCGAGPGSGYLQTESPSFLKKQGELYILTKATHASTLEGFSFEHPFGHQPKKKGSPDALAKPRLLLGSRFPFPIPDPEPNAKAKFAELLGIPADCLQDVAPSPNAGRLKGRNPRAQWRSRDKLGCGMLDFVETE